MHTYLTPVLNDIHVACIVVYYDILVLDDVVYMNLAFISGRSKKCELTHVVRLREDSDPANSRHVIQPYTGKWTRFCTKPGLSHDYTLSPLHPSCHAPSFTLFLSNSLKNAFLNPPSTFASQTFLPFSSLIFFFLLCYSCHSLSLILLPLFPFPLLCNLFLDANQVLLISFRQLSPTFHFFSVNTPCTPPSIFPVGGFVVKYCVIYFKHVESQPCYNWLNSKITLY